LDELGSNAALNAHIASVETVISIFEGVDCWNINYLLWHLFQKGTTTIGEKK
jgi:hypothetical protein